MGFRNYWNNFRKKQAINRIRRDFYLMGYDVSHLSDEDIEQGVVNIFEALRNVGVSAKEAADSMSKVFKLAAN